MTVTVTADHIARAARHRLGVDPVSLAVKDALRYSSCECYPDSGRVEIDDVFRPMPARALSALRQYNATGQMEPFTFEL